MLPVAIVSTWSSLSIAADSAAPPPPSQSSASIVAEIVVTATRREASIDRIPVSISAYSQDSMDQQGIKSIDDVAKFTPGLNFAPQGDGLTSSIAIRGVSSGVGASTTGVYIDDTPIQIRSGTGVVTENAYPQVFDLQRVEVLRGPQGTLFGTGSMGGTIRFITPEPDLDKYSAYSRAEFSSTKSGDPSYEVGAAAGGPLVDGKLGFRASAFYSDLGGYVDRRPFDGSQGKDNINYERTTALRAALKYAPNDSLTITPSISYQRRRKEDSYFWLNLSDPDSSRLIAGYTQPQPSDDEFTLSAVNLQWQFDQVDLISNSSYFHRVLDRSSDYSNFTWVALVGDPTPTAPLADYRTNSLAHVAQNTFTQEIRLQSTDTASAWQWVVGAMFQSSALYTNQYVVDPMLPQLTEAVYGAPIQDIFGVGLMDGRYSATIDQWAKDKQSALFGQVDYSFTDHLKATVGVRVARVTLDFSRMFGGPLLCKECTGEPESTGGKTPAKTPVTPRFGLSYETDDHSLYYVNAAKGFRVGGVNNPSVATSRPGCPGGLQAPETYAPDNLWSYEIGAKNQFADGRVRTQASVYYIDWQDIQQSVSASGCFTSSYKDNLGAATIKGFDLSLELRPTDSLLLALAGGYTHARYSANALGSPAAGTGIRPIIAADGDSLGVAPWNATLSGEYQFAAWSHDGYFRVDYTYTAVDDGMTPRQNPINGNYDPDDRADPAIRLLGARLGMRIGAFDVSIFGRNLLNDQPALGRNHDDIGDPLFYAITLRPRTIGVTGTYRY